MRTSELYSPKPTKGATKTGHQMIIWDAVEDCPGEACAIYSDCPYVKAGHCMTQTKYLKAVLDTVIEDVGNKMTQPLLNKICLHLFPLFHQLIKLKMIAHAVRTQNVVYTTNGGQIKIHPVLKEIRDVLAKIEGTQRSMGIDQEYIRAYGLFRPGEGGARGRRPRSNDLDGDPDWYDSMFTEQGQPYPDGPRKGVERAQRPSTT